MQSVDLWKQLKLMLTWVLIHVEAIRFFFLNTFMKMILNQVIPSMSVLLILYYCFSTVKTIMVCFTFEVLFCINALCALYLAVLVCINVHMGNWTNLHDGIVASLVITHR